MTGRLWAIVALVALVALGAGVGVGAAAWAGGDDAMPGRSSGGHGEMMMGGSDMPGNSQGGQGRMMMGGSDMPGMGSMSMDERPFMEVMVPHHQSAVDMARMALERAERPEVRRLARAVVAAQEDEIARMRAWHEDWFGEPLREDRSGPHGMVDMTGLERAADVDRAFLRMMIPHHASAIMMADAVMMSEPRPEIAGLAEEIIAAQAKEIGQMQSWREQWYPPRG